MLWSTDPRVGLDPSSTADQTARLQGFFNLLTQSTTHSARAGYLVPGTYIKTAPIGFLNTNPGRPYKLIGRASKGGTGAASVILDSLDGGPGTYSVNITGDATFYIEGISLVGGYSASPGSVAWQMRAICLPTYCTVRDFAAEGYFAGVTLMGDHMLLEDFDVRGNAYGIDFGPNAVTQGDVIVRRGRAGDCSIGAIGVARSGTLAGVRMQDVDCSSTPYVIKRYDDGTGASMPNWIDGADFMNMGTENVGNAIVCNTIDTSGITDVTFDHGYFGNPGLYGGPVDPTGPQLAAWYTLGNVNAVTFPKSLPSFTATQPAILAYAIGPVISTDGAAVQAACASGRTPIDLLGCRIGKGVGSGDHLNVVCGNGGGNGVLVVACVTDSAVGEGCCVAATNLYDVTPYAGVGQVLGVAAHATASGQVVHVVANGIQRVLNTSGTDIAENQLIVPNVHGGVAGGSYSNGQVLGRAVTPIPAGQIGLAELRLHTSF